MDISCRTPEANEAAAAVDSRATKRPLSAYFWFLHFARIAAKKGGAFNNRDFMSACAAKWRVLTDDEKNAFTAIAASDKARYTEEKANAPPPSPAADASAAAALSPTAGLALSAVSTAIELPMARIKRLMRCDPDVKTVSKIATVLMAKATEEFIQSLVAGSIKASAAKRRKTVKYEDVATAVLRADHFAFLAKDLPIEDGAAERRKGDAARRAAARRAAAKSKVVDGAGSIGNFFGGESEGASPTPAVAPAEVAAAVEAAPEEEAKAVGAEE